jgi:DNA-binding GntR family transcriptional regulator
MSSRDLSSALPRLQGATTLPGRLYEQLETAIINGTLEPGQRLHADDLGRHFGVSRIPVREALSSLDQAGWVEITPRHGVHVRQRTPEELAELFEFRADVEALVARWAAQRRSDADLARLADAADIGHEVIERGDIQAVMDASTTFRDAMRAAAHNSVLAATSAALEKRARFYFSTVAHDLGSEWVHVHDQVLERVEAADPDGAAELAARHIIATGSAVDRLLFGEGLQVRDGARATSGGRTAATGTAARH